MVRRAGDYAWSSARAHLRGADDDLVKARPLLAMAGPWKAFLAEGLAREAVLEMQGHERTGRPLGGESFLDKVERVTGRTVRKLKPGRKPGKKTSSK